MHKLLFTALLFFYSSLFSYAQLTLKIVVSDTNNILRDPKLEKELKDYKTFHNGPLSINQELQLYTLSLNEAGFLAASIDSIYKDSLKTTAYLHLGKKFLWANLSKGNVDEGILSIVGFREKLYLNKRFSLKDVKKLQEKILTYCENNGYPFASIKLDSISINESAFKASLNLDKKQLTKIDSLSIKGNAKIVKVYLYSYLGIKPGSLYNESLISRISTRLMELPFLSESKRFDISFSEKETKLNLYLQNKKANQFDGIIGFLPDNTNSSKLVVTGEAKLKLLNSFGRGEQIDLNWRKIGINTQDLKTRFSYPFLFSSPFGIELNLSLYKKDTLFVDLIRNVALQYLLQGGNYLKIFLNNKQSNLLSSKGFETLTSLPPYADVSATIYGLGLKMEKLDYRLNPRKGYSIETNGGAGNKHIEKNSKIPAYLYETIKTDVTQYNIDYVLETYVSFSTRMVLNTGIRGAHLISSSIFQNELYRIGGLRTFRGFDEESIFASSYSMLKFEYRYILETNAYMFGFWNGGIYENKSVGKHIKDKPFGFGAGITFETKLGIFSVTYALGKQFDNPIPFRSGKIHFGIVNNF